MPKHTLLAAVLSCLAAAAHAQQQTHFDATHCYAGTTRTDTRGQAYTLMTLDIQGTVLPQQQGGTLERHVSHCVAAGSKVGNGPLRLAGNCEFSASGDDRLLTQWTLENGKGTGTLIGGTGRYSGISGTYRIEPSAPYPAPDDGVIRGCNHLIGDFITK